MTTIDVSRLRWDKEQSTYVPANPELCEPHTPAPKGYLAWHAWAERMDRTHTVRQCRGCTLWAIWEPRRTLPGHPVMAGAGYDCSCGACLSLPARLGAAGAP